MWSSWAFCELVHMSMPIPCLSIKQSGVDRRIWVVGFLAKPQVQAKSQIRSTGLFFLFVDDQWATAAAGVHDKRGAYAA